MEKACRIHGLLCHLPINNLKWTAAGSEAEGLEEPLVLPTLVPFLEEFLNRLTSILSL